MMRAGLSIETPYKRGDVRCRLPRETTRCTFGHVFIDECGQRG